MGQREGVGVCCHRRKAGEVGQGAGVLKQAGDAMQDAQAVHCVPRLASPEPTAVHQWNFALKPHIPAFLFHVDTLPRALCCTDVIPLKGYIAPKTRML